MAEPQTPDRREPAPSEPKLYTLSEISQRSGISMPTLQRYKKTYQGRIPSVGSGRKQRYPENALPVFAELRSENAGKRGRPRKDASAAAKPAAAKGARTASAGRRPAAAKAAKGSARAASGRAATTRPTRGAAARNAAAPEGKRRGRPAGSTTSARNAQKSTRGGRASAASAAPRRAAGRPARAAARGRETGRGGKTTGLLTLTQISETTKISYPTLVRYVRLYSDRLPHEGKGRARRFYPEAVEVFRSLRQESGRSGAGRRAAGRPAAGKRPALRRGRPPKAAAAAPGRLESMMADRLRDLERFQQAIEKRFSDLVKGLQKLR